MKQPLTHFREHHKHNVLRNQCSSLLQATASLEIDSSALKKTGSCGQNLQIMFTDSSKVAEEEQVGEGAGHEALRTWREFDAAHGLRMAKQFQKEAAGDGPYEHRFVVTEARGEHAI